jgi:hypothetical protein
MSPPTGERIGFILYSYVLPTLFIYSLSILQLKIFGSLGFSVENNFNTGIPEELSSFARS